MPCRAENLVLDAIFALKSSAISMSSYSPKPMLQSRDFSDSEPHTAPTQSKTRHRPVQQATNGSPHPRVLNPGPLPLGPGIETRHTHRSLKASDVPRFWLGRSVARRLLGLAIHRKDGNDIPHRRERYPLLAVRSRTSTAESFPNQNEQRESHVHPADLVLAAGEVLSVRERR